MSGSSNSVCTHCKRRFNISHEDIAFCSSCGSLRHHRCVVVSGYGRCPRCEDVDAQWLPETDASCSQQKRVDIHSLKKTPFQPTIWDYLRVFSRIPPLMVHFGVFYIHFLLSDYRREVFVNFLEAVNSVLNIHVKVVGFEKLDCTERVIYVSNHVSYHDALTLPRFVDSGVIASVSASSSFMGNIFKRFAPTLVISRGSGQNTVDLMRQFLMRHPSLYVFPQGLLGRWDTLTRFRTGAFALGLPVRPVIAKYRQDVSSMSLFHLLCHPRVDLEVCVMDTMECGEGEEIAVFAERVRLEMAQYVNFLLSDVTSHDAVD